MCENKVIASQNKVDLDFFFFFFDTQPIIWFAPYWESCFLMYTENELKVLGPHV